MFFLPNAFFNAAFLRFALRISHSALRTFLRVFELCILHFALSTLRRGVGHLRSYRKNTE
jgi:hypothetical protein